MIKAANEAAEAAKKAAEEATRKAEEETRLAKEEAQALAMAADEGAAAAKKATEETISRINEESRLATETLHKLEQINPEKMACVLHELRTPLHSITGFSRLILEGRVPDSETREEFLTIIVNQSEHLRMLLDELADIPSVESDRFEIRKEYVSTKDLLQNAVQELYSVASEKGIELSKDIPLTLPNIEVDGKRLRQVVFNLISNAIKFSPGGRQIVVTIEDAGPAVQVSVSDQGIGVPKDQQERIFERFYQVDGSAQRRFGGTGLGLAIVKRIVEAHEGQVWVESDPGKGSTFYFTVPKYQDRKA